MFVSSLLYFFFLFKQKTAYEMRISDWSSDVCSSDLGLARLPGVELHASCGEYAAAYAALLDHARPLPVHPCFLGDWRKRPARRTGGGEDRILLYVGEVKQEKGFLARSEEHTSELQSLMRISYAVFCLKKKMKNK